MGKNTDREGPIHRSILNYLRLQYPRAVIHHSPNEGVRGGRRGAWDGVRKKAMGQLAGFPDIIMLHDGAFYAFEVKAERGYPTQAQKDVGAQIEANGGVWAVVRSIDDVAEVIEEAEAMDGWAIVQITGKVT